LKIGHFDCLKFVGFVVGIFGVVIFEIFVGRGGVGSAVAIEVRDSSGGWQWLVEHRGRKEGMVGEKVVVEWGESGGGRELFALEN